MNGIILPFAFEAGLKGSAEKQKITISKFELNVPVDDSIFKMPPPAPRLQHQHQHQQRPKRRRRSAAPLSLTAQVRAYFINRFW